MKRPLHRSPFCALYRDFLVRGLLAFALAAFTLAHSFAAEQSIKSGDIIVSSPWVRAMLPGQATGGGYLTIENTGKVADSLVSVTSPNAALVEIHQMSMDENVMKMRQITNGLEIPASGKVELSPGGLHLMFKQVKVPFRARDTVKVTLEFIKAGKIDVEMPIAFANPN
jgi:periplasmic copper chaperone A